MTIIVITAVSFGMATGYFLLPPEYLEYIPNILDVGLFSLLFFVGIDIGYEGTGISSIKSAGFRILMFPLAIIIGTFIGAIFASFILPISTIDSIIVASGFGWYSLAPIIISDYSTEVSAISFMHNVFRELMAIICIPLVAKYIGYIETTSLPGAAAMDVCLPVVVKSTTNKIAIYSFMSGLVLSVIVPIVVPILISFAK